MNDARPKIPTRGPWWRRYDRAKQNDCRRQEQEYRAGIEHALRAGREILDGGGSSLDAVEAAVRVLEDDPHFNAGKGSVFTSAGTNEMDAAIMDGKTLTPARSPVRACP